MLLIPAGLQHLISNLTLIDKFPAVLGEFVWTGFDYIGEPTPYSGDLTGQGPTSRRFEETKKMLEETE